MSRINIMQKYLLFGICGFLLLPGIVYGQGFTGPGVGNNYLSGPVMVSQPIMVSEVRGLPHDSWVVISGNIVNMLPGGKNYTFRDSSGEIIVEIGAKHWRGLSAGVSDSVVIYGEVKINRGLVSIKAHAISGSGRTTTWPGQAVFIDRPITIAEAVTLPHDSFVILQGNIINSQSRRNNYTFRDSLGASSHGASSQGEITVDIGNKHWRGLSVGVSDRVEIFGEVKNNRGLVTIKVHAIRAL